MVKKNMSILVVDDEKDYCEVLKLILENDGYSVETCFNGQEALKIMENKAFDIVVSDLSMPVMDGFELLKAIKERDYDADVLMLTAYGTVEKAVEAMKAGAYTYVTKGMDPAELLIEIRNIRDKRITDMKNALLREKARNKYMLESKSPRYRQMLEMAEKAAASESNIMLFGESGSGKEVLATFIHERSNRKDASLLDLNCQALSDSILESELFGHEKGSFTGATQRRMGLFEAASGGTLFLDEIGGVSMNLQAKLLKAIENRTIYRMGEQHPDKCGLQADNGHQQEPEGGYGQWPFQKRSVLQDKHHRHRDTSSEGEAGRYTIADRAFHRQLFQRNEKGWDKDQRRCAGDPDGIRLSRQRKRAEEHYRAMHGAVGTR